MVASKLSARVLASACAAAIALSSIACASSTPGTVMTKKVDTMREERTADKLLARGKAFAGVADWTRAEQYLAAAIDGGADEREVMPMLLQVCVEDRRYRVAVGYAEEFLRRHPADVPMHYVLATLDAAVGDAPSARANLEVVLAAHPKDAEPHYVLATVLRDARLDLVSMDYHFREYLRLAPQGAHAEEARASLLKTVP